MDTSKIYDKVIFLDIDGVLNSDTTTKKIPDI